MIAGPNGSGKTTTAFNTLPELGICEFLNADEIAKGLSPLNPESVPVAASKIMLGRFFALLRANESFGFETTASGKNYIKHLLEAKKNGYVIHLFFLWLDSPELAIKRVAERVKQGGHNIPTETIRTRYVSGVKNLVKYYIPLANTVLIMNNSFAIESKKIVASKEMNDQLIIEDNLVWEKMQRIADA